VNRPLDFPDTLPFRFRRHLLIAALSCAAWTAAALAAEAAPPAQLALYVAADAAPKMFLQDAKPTGYMTELAHEALRRAGYDVEVRSYPWARTVMYAQSGFGVITSLSHTPERDKLFVFSDPIYEDRVLMITRHGAGLQLSGLADLTGLRVGVQQGASFGPAFEAALQHFVVERDDSADKRLRKVAAGRIDVALLSGGPPALRYYATRAGVDLSLLDVQKSPLLVDSNHIAVARSRPDADEIIRRVNAAIAAMRKDGSGTRILGRYE
jgi:polar amino acid transport system substrate-binding protein